MSQEFIYFDIYQRLIYNPYAKRIEITNIGEYSITDIMEQYEDFLEEALYRLKFFRAIKRYRVYGSKLYLYLE